MGYDPSDGRIGTVGVGYAPTPADGRGEQSSPANPVDIGTDRGGTSFAVIAGYSAHAQETDPSVSRNEDGDPLSGAQQGSPEFMYPLHTLTGMQPEEVAPLDGGMSDPIRRGDTPARRPMSRFLVITSKWVQDIMGDFSPRDRVFAGDGTNGPKASQPVGRMDPMDEYRILGDGSHA